MKDEFMNGMAYTLLGLTILSILVVVGILFWLDPVAGTLAFGIPILALTLSAIGGYINCKVKK